MFAGGRPRSLHSAASIEPSVRMACIRFAGPLFFDRIDPELQGQILALWVAQVGAWPNPIALPEQLQIESDGARQVPHVVAVAFDIAFEFGEREVVWIERHEMKVAKRPWEHLLEPALVLIGRLRYGHTVQIYPIFLVQRSADH